MLRYSSLRDSQLRNLLALSFRRPSHLITLDIIKTLFETPEKPNHTIVIQRPWDTVETTYAEGCLPYKKQLEIVSNSFVSKDVVLTVSMR